MQDARHVKLLVRNREGNFLVLRQQVIDAVITEAPDLPGGLAAVGEDDVATLDRVLRDEFNIFLQTQEAVQVGYDVEYEPGEGLMTRVLYLLKIDREWMPLGAGRDTVHYDWLPAHKLRNFEPPFQVLVQTALDFYLPSEG